ncbi:MAG: SDR family oxidoreductase [Clostridiales bacterium]|nr:SDR family oxidoreductase [Clostridiales bacterium]
MAQPVVLITGGSRGIGREAARLFAARGYRVLIGYHRSREAAECLEGELTAAGADAMSYGVDVSVPAQVRGLIAACLSRFGRLDVLVNNAGLASQKLVTEVTDEEWNRLLAVNVSGAFYCCREALPAMLREHRGAIVNVSSMWGIAGASCEVAYSAAKAALIGLTRALAREVGPSGIRVNCVAPGAADTDMLASLTAEDRRVLAEETPLGRIGTPEEMAHAICFLASEEASFITGQVLSPNGGLVI